MIKRIDLFAPPFSQYSVLHHFTFKLQEALTRCGVTCRVLTAEKYNPAPFLKQLLSEPPDCTLSFNGLLPDDQGNFFCDMLHIPHVAWLVDSPISYVSLAQSPLTIIATVDENACHFFKEMGVERALFIPHGIEKNLPLSEDLERPYDVVLLASCIDYEAIAEQWQQNLPPELCELLHGAAEKSLASEDRFYISIFIDHFNHYLHTHKGERGQYDFLGLLHQLEMYMRGVERVRLVKAIRSAQVEIFGNDQNTRGWHHYLGDQPNVNLHPAVSFDEAIELMRQAKIVLHSCPWIKGGVHERILAGMAAGAVVVTPPNRYLRQHFTDGRHLIYADGDKLNDQIAALLANGDQRKQIALAARKTAIQQHSWDQRASMLLRGIAPLIQAIQTP